LPKILKIGVIKSNRAHFIIHKGTEQNISEGNKTEQQKVYHAS